jgi:hypothetical protein
MPVYIICIFTTKSDYKLFFKSKNQIDFKNQCKALLYYKNVLYNWMVILYANFVQQGLFKGKYYQSL